MSILTIALSVSAFTFISRMKLVLLSWGARAPLGGNRSFHRRYAKLTAGRTGALSASLHIGQLLALAAYTLAFAPLFQGFGAHVPGLRQAPEAVRLGLEIAASFALFIVLSEAFQRLFANRHWNPRVFAIPLAAFAPLYPLAVLGQWLAGLLSRSAKEGCAADRGEGAPAELFLLSEGDALRTGRGGRKDIKIFQNALDFSEVKLHECMVPRNEIFSIAHTATMDALLGLLVETGHSRILVYRDTKDNIIGYVSAKDLFKDFNDIVSMLRPVDFVPETMPAQKLLASFIKNKQSIAVVVDEFGGTAGLVTLEDMMEEIFGDIEDEHDSDNLIEKVISDDEFVFSGRLEVDYLNERYGLSLPEGEEYETLAGCIIYLHERLPNAGEQLRLGDFTATVVKLSATRIELVRLKRLVNGD